MQTHDTHTLFLEESCKQFINAREHINHCLNQLNAIDIWWKPQESCNSVGIIIQHVCGNLRQWILSGVGGTPDTRDRPQEFLDTAKVPKAELQRIFSALIDEVVATLNDLPPERLAEHAKIQNTDQSLLGAVYVAMTHLDMHVGQILYLTHLREGPTYEVFWKPATEERNE